MPPDPATPAFDYLRCQRVVLLDMHVPDWDDRFLRRFDPVSMVDLYEAAGADAVMLYTNSHVGLCYWPSRTGQMHRGLDGRDIVGETVALLHERGMAVCAYYSSNFNNWAYLAHPEWRIQPAASGSYFGTGSKYGVCCPNNPEYLAFQLAQVDELFSSYPFDAAFFDMVFWTDVCQCAHCREKFGEELPATIDWASPAWVRFQRMRQQSLVDEHRALRQRVRRHRSVPVYCNAAPMVTGWRFGCSTEEFDTNDMIGGDYGGGGLYPYLHFISRRSPSVVQYMNAVSGYIGGSSAMKTVAEQTRRHALVATLFQGQYMAIDAVEPDGTVNPGLYEELRLAFDTMRPYAGSLGGRPVAEVAVYWSIDAIVNTAESGTPVASAPFAVSEMGGGANRHSRAVVGTVNALRDAHLPVGVISGADLASLDQFAVVVLPQVTRMSAAEVSAFRDFVARGGRLLATGATALLDTDGTAHNDFMLADVFGCHLEGVEPTVISYIDPHDDGLAALLRPLRLLPVGQRWSHGDVQRVRADGAQVLATVAAPFGFGLGTRDDEAWASIHAAPPVERTDRPAILHHHVGAGEVLYVAGDIDTMAAGSDNSHHRRVLAGLVRSLLRAPPIYEVDADPEVWAVGFLGRSDLRLNLLDHALPPRGTGPVTVWLRPPAGTRFGEVSLRPGQAERPVDPEPDGRIRIVVDTIDPFVQITASLERAPDS